jgi:hypothetical protein
MSHDNLEECLLCGQVYFTDEDLIAIRALLTGEHFNPLYSAPLAFRLDVEMDRRRKCGSS